jgi:hypothetical protein
MYVEEVANRVVESYSTNSRHVSKVGTIIQQTYYKAGVQEVAVAPEPLFLDKDYDLSQNAVTDEKICIDTIALALAQAHLALQPEQICMIDDELRIHLLDDLFASQSATVNEILVEDMWRMPFIRVLFEQKQKNLYNFLVRQPHLYRCHEKNGTAKWANSFFT